MLTQSIKEDPMKHKVQRKAIMCFLLALVAAAALSACALRSPKGTPARQDASEELDTSRFLVGVEDEPDTVDFQCTSIHYTIAQNVFNRLVEMENSPDGNILILPSLAESWEISEDGRTYTFHLRENVRFSNGSPLTASDVYYTFVRLLTHPESCNRDIADGIVGAAELESGQTKELEGFRLLSGHDFSITLKEPFAAFLACL